MILIFEGVDNTGKTTLINNLNKVFGFKVIHCTRQTPNNFDHFISLLNSNENLIFDRFHLGQQIYQTEEERIGLKWMTNDEYKILDEVISKRKDIICIYVDAPDKTCLYGCKIDKNDSHYTLDYIRELKSKYQIMISKSKINWVHYYNDFIPDGLMQIIKDKATEQFNYSSLPHIVAVDFDGCLFKTEFPNKIIEPNRDLIYELIEGKYKDSKKILFSCRTGRFLDEAVEKCKEEGLLFDAINDNIQEVKDNLFGGPRKVYANLYIDDSCVNVKFDKK